MKKKLAAVLILIAFTVALTVTVFAQGDQEWDRNVKAPIDGMATKSIINYNHSKANVTVPLATNTSKFCVFSTKALKFYVNDTTGEYRTIPANTEYCRTVRKGVTTAVFAGASTAVTRVEVERQF